MSKLLIVGCGISGLSAAIRAAENGSEVLLVSPDIPERSQSVMAAGGINGALDKGTDSPECHAEDTFRCGHEIDDREMIDGLCRAAPEILRDLDNMGVPFRRRDGTPALRGLGGHSHARSAFAGAATGKQIVSTLSRRLRPYIARGQVTHRRGMRFLGGLIENNTCYGAAFLQERTGQVESLYADAVILATGGQNKLFGKTTGSAACDGGAAAVLLRQGAAMRNLEFIQYHPTTIETAGKRMLISEAARGEGGRLFYEEKGTRVYFLEDKYGPRGNLMPRDVVSREMFLTGRQVYLDISFLPGETIETRLGEIRQLCADYLHLDVTAAPIPVAPSVHFFMGGLAVNKYHETTVKNLYAVGECASAYHGANRLGGNSLLAAVYSGRVAADACKESSPRPAPDFTEYINSLRQKLADAAQSRSPFPTVYVLAEVGRIMNRDMGIVRDEPRLRDALDSLTFYAGAVEKLCFDGTLSLYESYVLPHLLLLARGVVACALYRRESRGAHARGDFPETEEAFAVPSYVNYNDGKLRVSFGEVTHEI